jgi:hypothetical protein
MEALSKNLLGLSKLTAQNLDKINRYSILILFDWVGLINN